MNTWKEECVYLLKNLGGHAYLSQIYKEFETNGTRRYIDNYEAVIRGTLEKGSRESDCFDGDAIFYMVDGKGGGHYGLLDYNYNSKEKVVANNKINNDKINNKISINNKNNDYKDEFTKDENSILNNKKFYEGKEMLKLHLVKERNPEVVKFAKKKFKQKHGHLFCEVCGFDFSKAYGELGEDFIEAHHNIPISQMTNSNIVNVNDIAMVCSNCHSMIHRKKPWLTIGELKELIKKNNL